MANFLDLNTAIKGWWWYGADWNSNTLQGFSQITTTTDQHSVLQTGCPSCSPTNSDSQSTEGCCSEKDASSVITLLSAAAAAEQHPSTSISCRVDLLLVLKCHLSHHKIFCRES